MYWSESGRSALSHHLVQLEAYRKWRALVVTAFEDDYVKNLLSPDVWTACTTVERAPFYRAQIMHHHIAWSMSRPAGV